MTLCIGLTGGIGCGKSTVAQLFAAQGAAIIDTDAIAHQLTQPGGAAIAPIRAAFGDACIAPDGALDRARMRRLIFSDVDAKRRLEGILHPLILEQCKMELQQACQAPYVIAVVPLLLGSPEFLKLVRRVLVVDCGEETQIARVTGRSQLSRAEVQSIIAQQTPRAVRLARADDLIVNDADIDALEKQVEALHQSYSGLDKQNSN
jgi:dephospho-CoA kinase